MSCPGRSNKPQPSVFDRCSCDAPGLERGVLGRAFADFASTLRPREVGEAGGRSGLAVEPSGWRESVDRGWRSVAVRGQHRRQRHSAVSDEEGDVRIDGSVTSISWVPADAVERDAKAELQLGTSRADEAPPADLGPDIDATLDAVGDRYRFANHLRGFAEFDDDGEVRCYGDQGSGRLGQPTVREGVELAIGTIPMPERRGEPVVGSGWVRFHQTWGGRTAARVAKATLRPPFVRFERARRVDDARAHTARRRAGRRTTGRRVAVPASLGLRHRRSPRRDERHHGLEGLGRIGDRHPHAVG